MSYSIYSLYVILILFYIGISVQVLSNLAVAVEKISFSCQKDTGNIKCLIQSSQNRSILSTITIGQTTIDSPVLLRAALIDSLCERPKLCSLQYFVPFESEVTKTLLSLDDITFNIRSYNTLVLYHERELLDHIMLYQLNETNHHHFAANLNFDVREYYFRRNLKIAYILTFDQANEKCYMNHRRFYESLKEELTEMNRIFRVELHLFPKQLASNNAHSNNCDSSVQQFFSQEQGNIPIHCDVSLSSSLSQSSKEIREEAAYNVFQRSRADYLIILFFSIRTVVFQPLCYGR